MRKFVAGYGTSDDIEACKALGVSFAIEILAILLINFGPEVDMGWELHLG